MEEELTDSERAQLRRIVTLQKVIWGIVLKWAWLLAAVAFTLCLVFGFYLSLRASKSVSRFTAETKLLYNPRSVDKVETISDKQILSILERKSLKRRVGDIVDMPADELMCLGTDMEIVQERKPTNLFTLKAASKSWKGAVKKVNAYAEILIEEYTQYRSHDLENWRESLSARRASLIERLSEIDAEETTLKAKTGILAPPEALLALSALISDQRRNASAIGVDIANEELKKRKHEESVGKHGAVIIANAEAIRKRTEAISAIDAELAKLREMYTDLNPKVAGKLEEREALVAELHKFLNEKGAQNLDLDKIDSMEMAAGALSDSITLIEVLNEKRRAIEQEIADNEKRAAELAALIPDYERLQTRRADVSASIRALDEQLNDITYVIGSLHNDLRQIERSGGAGDKGPIGVKQTLLAIIGSAICTGSLLLWIIVLELVFGKVRGGAEVAAYDGMKFLGSLPKPGLLSADDEREVMGVVALKMFLAGESSKVVLVCRLTGAEVPDAFVSTLDFTASMSGVSGFLLDVVSSAHFTPPEGAEQMIGILKQGTHGWFAAVNRFAMAPTELQMLQADIAELRNSFDTVFIRMEGGVTIGGTFFDQLLGLCDSVILEVGAGATPRSQFGYVRRHVSSTEKPIMAMATGANAKVVRTEMEARI